MNRLSSRLAARTGTRQLDLLHAANGAGFAAAALIRERWNDLLALLMHPACRGLNCPTLAWHLHGILAAVRLHLRDTLTRFAHFGHDSAASVLVNTIPARTLLRGKRVVPVFEAKPQLPGIRFPPPRPPREPVVGGSDDERRRRELQEMLFPAPSEAKVADILRRPVFGQTWEQELSSASRLAGFDPDLMAQTIASSFALGKTPQEIAKDLRPAVAEVGSTARRIARTYGMQISHAVTREAHEQLGDLLVGYQTHAQFDSNTRSWHASRSGTIYYAKPTEGQKGYFQMPNPPLEADDPNERPAGAPKTAWH